jgi:hypothetical protein
MRWRPKLWPHSNASPKRSQPRCPMTHSLHLRHAVFAMSAAVSAAVQTARKHAAPDSSASQKPMTDKWRNFKESIIDLFARGIIKKSETIFGSVKADVLALKDPEHFVRGNFCSIILRSAWPI